MLLLELILNFLYKGGLQLFALYRYKIGFDLYLDPKETWALITWIVFASYIHARLTKNWQGQKAALLGALGFVVVWVCYLGVNFLGKGLHSYGWLS